MASTNDGGPLVHTETPTQSGAAVCSRVYRKAFCIGKNPRRGQWVVNQSEGFGRGPTLQEHRLCSATTSRCFRSVCPRLLHSDHPRTKGKVFAAFFFPPLLFDRPDASAPNFLARGWLTYVETDTYFMTFLHSYYLLIYRLHETMQKILFCVCSAHPGSPTLPSGKRISPSYSTRANDRAALGVTELNPSLVVAYEEHYYLHSKVRSSS